MIRSMIRQYYRKVYQKLNYDVIKTNINLGKLLAAQNKNKRHISSLAEVEFQVFSQRGEDGIIQFIIDSIEIPNKIFIEFGVEDYTESNTRFLLMNNNWSGLVLDGDQRNIRFIQDDFIYWKYDIIAKNAFITKNNINQLIRAYTECEDIGLLSIDIDGNDYWIWQAIDVVKPRILICEYNSLFGGSKTLSVPYSDNFQRSNAHYSNLYFGASLGAFCQLAEAKGYDFIGTASTGVNAFFVRKDLSDGFVKFSSEEGFKISANRDSKNKNGSLSFLEHDKRLAVIQDMPIIDTSNEQMYLIKDLY